jgi:DNA-binding phage protein
MNQSTDEVGPSFLDAFCTILIQEHRGSKMTLAQWAHASEVDLHSLKLLREGIRAIRCEYAVRLCCGLGLGFERVLREAIQLKFKTADERRCAWKCQLIYDSSAHNLLPVRDARAFVAALCSELGCRVAESGKSFSQLARECRMERTVISRLKQPGRQNPSLQSLFELSCAVACQLDVQARKVASALQPSQGK